VMQGGADTIPALKSGRMDLAFGGYVSYFVAQAQGTLNLKIVTDAYEIAPGTHTILVPRDSPIHSPKDLAGKKIAINTKHNIGALLVHANLQPYGINFDEEKSVVEMPFPNMEAALKSKAVDAALFVEPFSTQAQQSIGARPIIDMSQGPTANFPGGGYVATADFVKKYPKTVAAFQRAIAKAQPLLADRKVLQEVIPTYTKVPAAIVPGLHFGIYTTSTSVARLQSAADIMLQFGYLKKRLDIRPMLMPGPSGQ
jgi:NitT/TauT family transport system substrate-binding protein